MKSVMERLSAGGEGDRSLGAANAIAGEALLDASVVKELVAALKGEPQVQVRAANALKKIAAKDAERLQPYAKKILRAALGSEELRATWNLTILLSQIGLKGTERAVAIDFLFESLRSRSGLQRTMAMQGLADFAMHDSALRRRVLPVVEEFSTTGTAAMRARARMLLKAMRKS